MTLAAHAHVSRMFRAEILELNINEREIVSPLEIFKKNPLIVQYITQVRALYVLLRTEAQFSQTIMLSTLHGHQEEAYRHVELRQTIERHIDECLSRCREYRSQILDPIS